MDDNDRQWVETLFRTVLVAIGRTRLILSWLLLAVAILALAFIVHTIVMAGR